MNYDNKEYLKKNPSTSKKQALKALQKAKKQEAKKIASGKKYIKINPRTRVLK